MAKMTISVVKGRGSIAHNNRDFIHDNVDPERTPDNKIYVQQPLKEAYQELFGAEVERYNQGKKPCRQIHDYMEHIRNSKNGEKLFYENVVQVGNKQDMEVPGNREKAIEILDQYAKNFQKHNPNLHVFNMVMHLDEATPHLHIDYIPIARGYKQGLQIRNSLDKALKEQGIDGKANKKENSTHNWQEQQKNSLEMIMREYGVERKAEKGLHREHMTVDQYKAVAEVVHNEVKNMPKQIETIPTMFNKKVVKVKVEDLENLEKRAKLSLEHEKASKQIEKGSKTQYVDLIHDKERELERQKQLTRELQREKDAFTRDRIECRKEQQKAESMKQKYEDLYHEQVNLNAKCEDLRAQIVVKDHTINELRQENTTLRGQIADLRATIEDRVQKAVEPLKEQIQGFMDKMKGMAETTRNITRAVTWIKDTFNNDKLHEVCGAVQDYSERWLTEDGFPDMAEGVRQADLSKGIKNYMKPDYQKIVYIKGSEGYGFYSSKEEGHVYLGKKSDLRSLQAEFPNAKFSDPFEHVPELSGRSH